MKAIYHELLFELERKIRSRQLVEDDIEEGLRVLLTGKKIIAREGQGQHDWLSRILESEKQAHFFFFGEIFDLSLFEEKLKAYGKRTVKSWIKLGLEPHYLPAKDLHKYFLPLSSRVGLSKRYQKAVERGLLLRKINGVMKKVENPYNLEGLSVLLDVRCIPNKFASADVPYKKFTEFEEDKLLGKIIAKLRKKGDLQEKRIGDHTKESRYLIHPEEWECLIRPIVAKKIGIEPTKLRYETAQEFCVIPQMFPYLPRRFDLQERYLVPMVILEEFIYDEKNPLNPARIAAEYERGKISLFNYSSESWDGVFRFIAII